MRPLCAAPGYSLWWRHTRAFRVRVARRSPRCCWPGRLSWKRVVGRLGNGLRTQQRPPHGTGSTESGWGDETPSSTRVPRTGLALHSRFTQELLATAKGGEAQCRPLSQGRLLYTMMMSAAVLARGLIGTC